MKSSLREELQRLTLRQQRRIWLNRVSNRIPAITWWSASVLFSGGVIHQLWHPLNTTLMLCITFLPSLLLLSWTAVTKKPTKDEGAADADRLLGANSLFVSAWELSRSRIGVDSIGTLLLNRAQAALPIWHQNFDTPPRSISTANLAAAALACLGLFILLMPTAIHTEIFASTAMPQLDKPLQQPDDSASVLSELLGRVENRAPEEGNQLTTVRNRQAASGHQSQHPPEGTHAETVDIGTESSRIKDQSSSELSASSAAAAHPALGVSQTGGRKIPSRTPGSSIGETSDRMTSKGAEFARRNLIDINGDADIRSTTLTGSDKDTGQPLSASNQSAVHPSPIRRSLKATQTISNSQLTVEQRVLAGRYFKQLEMSDESNE